MAIEAELKQLQQNLALVDLLTGPQPATRGDVIELLLLKLKELRIKMYQEVGHQTAHIHVDYGPCHHVASYSIIEPKRLAGTLDRKYDREVLDWITEHRDKLVAVWTAMRAGNDPSSIIGELAADG